MSEKLVLIDGHSILNRAFFGIPDLSNSEGLHTNAVYGFLNILFRILEEEKPDYLTVAFWTPIKKDAPFLCIEPWCGGTMDQVPNTDLLQKKYVQYLPAGGTKDYRFAFQPC